MVHYGYMNVMGIWQNLSNNRYQEIDYGLKSVLVFFLFLLEHPCRYFAYFSHLISKSSSCVKSSCDITLLMVELDAMCCL